MASLSFSVVLPMLNSLLTLANKRELVNDLIVKAKQIDYLIQSLPEPEPEEVQVGYPLLVHYTFTNLRPCQRPTGYRISRTKWQRQMRSTPARWRVQVRSQILEAPARLTHGTTSAQRICISKFQRSCVQC